MVALDGRFYRAKADGRAYEIDPRARTPFAVVTFFEPTLNRTRWTRRRTSTASAPSSTGSSARSHRAAPSAWTATSITSRRAASPASASRTRRSPRSSSISPPSSCAPCPAASWLPLSQLRPGAQRGRLPLPLHHG
jgi:hypothetical protein